MKIGIPKEIKNNENRVGITPAGVKSFVKSGHDVVIEKAAGIITEDGGLTSHAGVVGPPLRKPVIVGVDAATTTLRDGQMISMDPLTGKIYNA